MQISCEVFSNLATGRMKSFILWGKLWGVVSGGGGVGGGDKQRVRVWGGKCTG